MELTVPSHSGPPLHVHHREDETYYVLSGEFLLEVGGQKYSLPQSSTIFAPREIPHRWANVATADAKLILVCTPGGFERFFDETAKAILDKAPLEKTGSDNVQVRLRSSRPAAIPSEVAVNALGTSLTGDKIPISLIEGQRSSRNHVDSAVEAILNRCCNRIGKLVQQSETA